MQSLNLDELHIHLLRPLSQLDPMLESEYLKLLAPDEKQQHASYPSSSRNHCLDYLLTRVLVRTTLSRYVDVHPERWRFRLNAHGRPEIESPPTGACGHLRFNLSNTRGLIACAVIRGRDVGVDVEWTRRLGMTVELAEQYFAAAEARALRNLPATRQRERFFCYWTLKESYIKARGLGLSIPLEMVSFLVEEEPIRVEFDDRLGDRASDWQFGHWQIGLEHVIAYAVRRGEAGAIRVFSQNFSPLETWS